MGRHTAPGTGSAEPDRGFWVRLGVVAVVAVLVGGFLVARWAGSDGSASDGDRVRAAASTSAGTPSGTAPASPGPTPASSTPAATPSPTPKRKPATLAFTVRYPAYITVRIPGGRTLVSKLFKKGATASFNAKVLQVVNGRPDAVRFVVNGTPRKPGPSGRVETFTVRRKV